VLKGIEIDGLTETLGATRELETALRRQTNSELRRAAGDCARALVGELHAAAARSGVPVAPRVARSVRVKSDRLPVVAMGGRRKVGRNGATAASLFWGSEHGPASDINRFGVPPRPDGYWVAPTVARFASNRAVGVYLTQVAAILRRVGLI